MFFLLLITQYLLGNCLKNFASLKVINSVKHDFYLADYYGLMKSSEGALTIKEDVCPEVTALAQPLFNQAGRGR